VAALLPGLAGDQGAARAQDPVAETLPGEAGTVVLLPGWRAASGAHLAALAVSLAPGWKTYWRVPGEAGIPPDFDWSGSGNIARVTVHWPRPTAFDQAGMTSLGYGGEIVLPLEVIPVDPAAPVALEGTVTLGVCRDICIPVTARLSAPLPAPGAPDGRIRAALDHGPEAIAGQATCAVAPIADGLRLTVTLPVAWDGVQAVAVEASDPSVWVSGAAVSRAGAGLVATVDLVPPSAAPFALDRSGLRFTVIAGQRAGEMTGCTAG
jgi:DsbC/DsbD-like thiol-disulfide interchange protein